MHERTRLAVVGLLAATATAGELSGLPGVALAALAAAVIHRRHEHFVAARGLASVVLMAFTAWCLAFVGVTGLACVVLAALTLAVGPAVIWYLVGPDHRALRQAFADVHRDFGRQIAALITEVGVLVRAIVSLFSNKKETST